MTTTRSSRTRRPRAFFLGFGLVTLLIAGALSYLADSDPDGLDTITRDGCTVREIGGVEQLEGSCIAHGAEDSPVAGSPLADYSVGGDEGLTGAAGVLGALATLGAAGGLFWLLRRRGGADRSG